MSFPNLSALAVRERAVTLFFILLSILAGAYSFISLGRAEDPAFTMRVLVVSALWPGATPEELERQVVDRLEKRIQEVEYFYRTQTIIHPGRADLIVQFQDFSPSLKVPELLYQVRKRVQDEASNLPSGVIGPLVNDDFGDVYFSLLAVTAPGLPMRDVTREAEAIRDRLQRVPGVQKALMIGERTERVYAEFDIGRLNNLGISARKIFDAIDANNRLVPSGFLDMKGPRVYVRVDADLSDPDRLATVPIRIGDRLLRLSDVATIHRGYVDPPTYLVRARGQDALLLGVVMQKGENGLEFGERLGAFIADEQRRLPLGISLSTLTNQTDAISAAVNLFQVKFLVAVAVVMGVSILAIGLRAGLIVGIAVPLTLGLTFLLMKLTGMNLDRITLGALIISLGLLVDDAIIAIEMMLVKMESGWDRVRAAGHAWNVTAAPMLSGTLVTVAGFVPIGFAQSSVGEYAGNIFWVLAYALLVSWVVAVTFTPYLGVRLLPAVVAHEQAGEASRESHAGHSIYDTPMYQRLRKLVAACVRRRVLVVAGTVGLLVLAIIGMVTAVEKQFFPSSDRPEVLVDVLMPQGSAIATTDETSKKLETILAALPEVKTLSAYIGGGPPRFFLGSAPEQPDPAFAKIIAIGGDADERDRIMAELHRHIDAGEFPEARIRVTRLLYGPPVEWPVSFRVLGKDPHVLRQIAGEVREIVAQHPKTMQAHLDWDERTPVIHLEMDPERLRLMGLTPHDVAQRLQFQLDGVAVTEVRQDIRTVQVRARGLRNMAPFPEMESPDGRKIPLAQLGKLQVRYEEPVVKRINRERSLSVHAEVHDAQPPDVTMEIWAQLADMRKRLPDGYRIDLSGSVEESGKADASIQKLQPLMIALMLIFIMLQMRSFSGTFMVLATAPLGLIGAVVALVLFRQPFGFVALLGLIGLAGILMRNTMILTQQVQDNMREGMEAREAVVEAAVRRARPVVLTALAAVLAFVPLTMDSFWGPLAYVLIGGVSVGTVISLLFVPALYALWFRLGKQQATSLQATTV
ncbi:MAG: efflux RND transporter permease subunit [Nitrospiraceae bacterium]